MSYNPNAYEGYGPPAPPPKKRKIWPWIVGGIILLLLLGMCGVAGRAVNQSSAPTVAPTAAPSPTPYVSSNVEEDAAPPPVPAVPAGPKTEFGNGTWEIGVDIAPGKYKTSGPEDSGRPCFAQTTKEGDASLGDIQKQELSEGPLTVIIPAKGVKFFESAGCSVWKKAE
jgi:hypothetical protein